MRVATAAHDPKQHRFEKSRKIRVSKVDQKGVFLERLFGAVVSIVTTMVTYQNVCAREDDRVQTLPGRSVEAQKNVENVSLSSFQIVAFEEDG